MDEYILIAEILCDKGTNRRKKIPLVGFNRIIYSNASISTYSVYLLPTQKVKQSNTYGTVSIYLISVFGKM